MTLPGKTQFRAFVAISIALYLVLMAINRFHLVRYTHEIAVARAWNHYRQIIPYRIAYGLSVTFAILFLAAQVGLLFFRRFARWLLASLLVGTILLDPFMGLLVLTPLEHFLAALVGLFTCLTLAMAIFSPLSAEFRK